MFHLLLRWCISVTSSFTCTLTVQLQLYSHLVQEAVSVTRQVIRSHLFFLTQSSEQIKRKIKLNRGGLPASDSRECLAYQRRKTRYPSVNSAYGQQYLNPILLPRCFLSSSVMVCSTQKEKRIIINSKINYSLIRMDCLPSLSHTLSVSSFSHFPSGNDTGRESNCLLAFHVGSERNISFSLAEGLRD